MVEGVLGLGQDLAQLLAIEILDRGNNREPPDELGNQTELDQILGHDLGEQLGRPDLVAGADVGPETHLLLSDP